jgi:hypothetical protein
MSAPNDIILYNYASSPFGRRISDYLALRGIEYALCVRTFLNLTACDKMRLTRRCRTNPSSCRAPISRCYQSITGAFRSSRLGATSTLTPLGATNGPDRFTEKLLEKYMIEGPVFEMAAGLVPVEMAQDPTFNKDRQGMLNRNWSREELEDGRGECLNYIRNLFDFYETTILEDGRDWILGNEGPKLADIEGEWCPMAMALEDLAHIASLAPSQVFYVRHVSDYSRCTAD